MRGTWVAQSVKSPALDFSSSHDLRILRLSPAAGSQWSLLKILSLSLPLTPLLPCALSLQ